MFCIYNLNYYFLTVSRFDFQLFYWLAVPQKEEPAMLPAVFNPRRLHSRTFGVYLWAKMLE